MAVLSGKQTQSFAEMAVLSGSELRRLLRWLYCKETDSEAYRDGCTVRKQAQRFTEMAVLYGNRLRGLPRWLYCLESSPRFGEMLYCVDSGELCTVVAGSQITTCKLIQNLR